MQKKRAPSPGEWGRLAALSVLLLNLLISWLLQGLTLCAASGAVAAACGILILVPSSDALAPLSLRWMWIQAVPALAVPFLCRAAPAFGPLFYAVAVLAPAGAGMTSRTLRLAADREFLSRDLPGWEYLLALSRKTFLYWLGVLLAVSWAGAAAGGPGGRIVSAFAVAGLSGLLAVLLVRSVTNQSLLSSGFESGLLGQVRDSTFLRPSPAARLGISHRMIFEKVCRHMESARPYLNDSLSLEDLARAVGTNKSYLSKVINTCTGMNFPQFVNNYRVRYSMELFRQDPRLKVAELAMMSGFHSGVTFTLAFRLFLGKTPSDWCREWRERVEPSG